MLIGQFQFIQVILIQTCRLVNLIQFNTYFRFFKGVPRRHSSYIRFSAARESPNDGENNHHEHDDRKRPESAEG